MSHQTASSEDVQPLGMANESDLREDTCPPHQGGIIDQQHKGTWNPSPEDQITPNTQP